jgi:hypothetical protein
MPRIIANALGSATGLGAQRWAAPGKRRKTQGEEPLGCHGMMFPHFGASSNCYSEPRLLNFTANFAANSNEA